MAFPMDSTELLLFFARFFIGSSVLLGGVWLLEKFNVLTNRDLAETAWKGAVLASFLLLFPVSLSFAPQIQLDAQTSQYINTLMTVEKPEVLSEPTTQPVLQQQMTPTPNNSTLIDTTTEPKQRVTPQNSWQMPTFLIIPALIAGLALLVLLLTYASAVRSLGARKRVAAEHPAFRLLFDICHNADIRATPYLTWTKRIDSPLCLPSGEICLPQWALEGIPEHELRSLIAHEVAHLKHRDPIILLVLHALTRLFFLQPLFAVAQKRLADLAEFAADEWAAGHSDNPKSVAEAIFTCAKQITNQQQPQWGLAMARDKSKLRARVDRLLDANETSFKTTAIWVKGVLGAALIALALGIPAIALGDKTNLSVDGNFSTSVSIKTSGNSNEAQSTYKQQNGKHLIEVNRYGKMTLSDDGNMIGNISSNGYFKLSEQGNGTDRSIKFTNNNGKLVHHFTVDGNKQQMSADDQQWLATMMLNYLRNSGQYASERVTKIIKSDGISAVLAELDHVTNRGLRFYTEALIKTGKLSSTDIQQIVKRLSRIKSDYEMRQAFTPLLALTDLSDAVMQDILKAVKSIESDYEMRVLLSTMISERALNDDVFATFIELSTNIASDYEMRVLLMAAIKSQDISTENLKRFVTIAKDSIQSDYELRLLIVDVAKHLKTSPEAVDVSIDALKSLGSDYEFRLAAKSIVDNAQFEQDGWLNIISATHQMSSDYETTQLILHIMSTMPDDATLLDAIVELAEQKVSSSNELKRIDRALKKAGRG